MISILRHKNHSTLVIRDPLIGFYRITRAWVREQILNTCFISSANEMLSDERDTFMN